jgi:hypothetical protein
VRLLAAGPAIEEMQPSAPRAGAQQGSFPGMFLCAYDGFVIGACSAVRQTAGAGGLQAAVRARALLSAPHRSRSGALPASTPHQCRRLNRADYTRGIAAKHIKRGYTLMCQWAGPALLLPVAASFGVSTLASWV